MPGTFTTHLRSSFWAWHVEPIILARKSCENLWVFLLHPALHHPPLSSFFSLSTPAWKHTITSSALPASQRKSHWWDLHREIFLQKMPSKKLKSEKNCDAALQAPFTKLTRKKSVLLATSDFVWNVFWERTCFGGKVRLFRVLRVSWGVKISRKCDHEKMFSKKAIFLAHKLREKMREVLVCWSGAHQAQPTGNFSDKVQFRGSLFPGK